MARRANKNVDDFESLYRETFPRIYNYLYYHLLDQQTAEDVASEVYIKAYRSFDSFDSSRASFYTWVYSIAHNELMNQYRRTKPTSDLDELPEMVFATEDSYDDEEERAEKVRALLSLLDEEDREIIYLKFWEGLQNKEIAERLGMNASTVSTRVSRAVGKLRKHVNLDDFVE